jgi:hypothetical protein
MLLYIEGLWTTVMDRRVRRNLHKTNELHF